MSLIQPHLYGFRHKGITVTRIIEPSRIVTILAALTAVGFLSACSQQGDGIGHRDPHEEANRRTHAFNLTVDRRIFQPASNAYGEGVSRETRRGVGRVASNFSLPGKVVNNLLQLDLEGAARNSIRFLINSTLGFGGIGDPAGNDFGLEEEETDFGETLYTWGFGEGRYVELPFVGPSTERHTVGRAVDLFTNPLGYVLDTPANLLSPTAQLFAKVGDRYEYSSTIDALLYESEDSYAQARNLYLQNRRFQLGVEVTEEETDEIDALFKELYGE